MVEKTGKFAVKEIAEKSVPEALAALRTKAGDNEKLLAEVTALEAIDWAAVPFSWKQSENLEEARQGYTDDDLLELLQKKEEAAAKSKEYQKITKAFRPDPNDPAVKRESMIKDFMKVFKLSEAAAIRAVDLAIAEGEAQ